MPGFYIVARSELMLTEQLLCLVDLLSLSQEVLMARLSSHTISHECIIAQRAHGSQSFVVVSPVLLLCTRSTSDWRLSILPALWGLYGLWDIQTEIDHWFFINFLPWWAACRTREVDRKGVKIWSVDLVAQRGTLVIISFPEQSPQGR